MNVGGTNRVENTVNPDSGNAAPLPCRLTQREKDEVDVAANLLRESGYEPTAERLADTTGHRLSDVRAYLGEKGSSATGQAQHDEEPSQAQESTRDVLLAYEPVDGGAEDNLMSSKGA